MSGQREAMVEFPEGLIGSMINCLERALAAMNAAVAITAEQGPGKAMESIADYLSDTDGISDQVLASLPADWLTRWSITRAAGS